MTKKTNQIAYMTSVVVGLSTMTNAASAQECSVPVITEMTAVKVSSGTDNDVNNSVSGLASAYYAAVGDSAKEVGALLAESDDPKSSAIGAALVAAGGVASGLSAIAGKIPALISSIDSSRNDADDLYISLAAERGRDGAFFPEPGEYTSNFQQGLAVKVKGHNRIVPYIFGLDPNETNVRVNLFDRDGGSRDDILGQATFYKKDAGTGPQIALAMTPDHGGVIYAIQYQVEPVPCFFLNATSLKQIYQTTSPASVDGSAKYKGAFDAAYLISVDKTLQSALASRGIR